MMKSDNYEVFKKELDKNIESLFNKANSEEKTLLNIMINTINDLCKEKQELIDYLKEKKKEYIELYNKSCDIIDFDRYESLNILCEEILSKIEKE